MLDFVKLHNNYESTVSAMQCNYDNLYCNANSKHSRELYSVGRVTQKMEFQLFYESVNSFASLNRLGESLSRSHQCMRVSKPKGSIGYFSLSCWHKYKIQNYRKYK